MVESTQELRVELAQATRVLARHNLVGMFGHVSVLTDDPSDIPGLPWGRRAQGPVPRRPT